MKHKYTKEEILEIVTESVLEAITNIQTHSSETLKEKGKTEEEIQKHNMSNFLSFMILECELEKVLEQKIK